MNVEIGTEAAEFPEKEDEMQLFSYTLEVFLLCG